MGNENMIKQLHLMLEIWHDSTMNTHKHGSVLKFNPNPHNSRE